MRTSTILLLGGFAITLAVFVYSRTRRGSAALSQASTAIANAAYAVGDAVGLTNRGLRDNNPGNIRRTGTQWLGELSQAEVEANGGTWDAEFEQFSSLAYGVRAVGRTITTYANSYGLNTARGIVYRYAPPSENDSADYASEVADALGVGIDEPFDVIQRLPDVVAAILRRESGFTADLDTITSWVYS